MVDPNEVEIPSKPCTIEISLNTRIKSTESGMITAVVANKDKKKAEPAVFNLKFKGALPKLQKPKIDPNVGRQEDKVDFWGNSESQAAKLPDPIQQSIDLRKKQPENTVTAVVKAAKKADVEVFDLKLKGGEPKLADPPKYDPKMG